MEHLNGTIKNWSKSNFQIFWGEIAPCDHLVQFYESNHIFLNTLEGFIGDGFLKGENVIIIATPEHISEINARLVSQNFDIEKLTATGAYIAVEVSEAISKFMINDWPDEKLFIEFVNSLLTQAPAASKTRVFGEIVAVLWEQGLHGATVQLEDLWHRFLHTNPFCLYCAYPKSGFTQDFTDSILNICKSHSRIIDGSPRPSTEIYYTPSVL